MSLPADRLAPRAGAAALGLGAVLGWAGHAVLASDPRVVPVGPPPQGSRPPLALFRDVEVVPAFPVAGEAPQHGKGRSWGAIWPDFEARTWERHNIKGMPVDVRPEAAGAIPERLDRPAVWLGYVSSHFGHLVAEQLTRALWSRTLRPRDLCLVPAARGPDGLGAMPRHFWEILAWLGVPRRRVRLVDRPLRVREPRVVPQAEQHLGPGPDSARLDLLDRAFQVACAAMRTGRPGRIDLEATLGRLEALRPRDAAAAPWRRPVSAPI